MQEQYPLTSHLHDHDESKIKATELSRANIPELPSISGKNSQVLPQLFQLDTDGILFCRSQEQRVIKDAYFRVLESKSLLSPEIIFIQGNSGYGKTTLAMSLKDIVNTNGGYFVKGKFDQQTTTIRSSPEPYAAIKSAFNEYISLVLSRDKEEVDRIQTNLVDVLGSEQQVMVDTIPDLKKILHIEHGQSTEPRADAITRFKFIFRMFVRAISCPSKPLIIFLDDLHWADETSLDLLETLWTDTKNNGIIFLCTYRDEDDVRNKNLDNVRGRLYQNTKLSQTNICLVKLKEDEVAEIVSKVLLCSRDDVQSLASLISRQTNGNLLFVLEYVYELIERKLISFDSSMSRWVWDTDEILVEFESMNELVTAKIDALPGETQELLEIASCLGSKVDDNVLKHIVHEPLLSIQKEVAIRKRLLKKSTDTFQFFHDGIREILYNRINENEREEWHYRLGKKLWRKFDLRQLDEHIFVVVGQFIASNNKLVEQREKTAVAKLCLRAGQRAAEVSSFSSAHMYLLYGLSLLCQRSWRDDYDFCLQLHNAASEISYCAGKLDDVLKLIETVLNNARNFDDTLRVRAMKVYTLGTMGCLKDACSFSFKTLEKLGEKFPSNPGLVRLFFVMQQLRRRLKNKKIEKLLDMPLMEDPTKLAAIQMLSIMFSASFTERPELGMLVGFRIVSLTLDYGACGISCLGFATLAMALCALGNIDEGLRIGQLGFLFCQKFNVKTWTARFSAIYFEGVYPWKGRVQDLIPPIEDAYRSGLESGDIEFAMVCADISTFYQIELRTLSESDRCFETLYERKQFYKQEYSMLTAQPMWRLLHSLMGKGRYAGLPDNATFEGKANRRQDATSILENLTSFTLSILFYLFGDYDKAQLHCKCCRRLASRDFSALFSAMFCLNDGLTEIQLARRKGRKYCGIAKKYSNRFRKLSAWAPHLFLGRHHLLEAELASLRGDKSNAYPSYVVAIAMSTESGHLLVTALANELAGMHFFRIGDLESAKKFLQSSIVTYNRWGASAKAENVTLKLKKIS